MDRSRTVVIAAGMAAVAMVATGCSREVSAEDIEDSIAEQADVQGFPLESVDCPSGLPPEVGAEVICDVVITGLVEVTPGQPEVVDRFQVQVRGVDRGDVRYSMRPLVAGTTE